MYKINKIIKMQTWPSLSLWRGCIGFIYRSRNFIYNKIYFFVYYYKKNCIYLEVFVIYERVDDANDLNYCKIIIFNSWEFYKLRVLII